MGKWEVRVRRYNNKTISKTFIQKEDAHKWARETETEIAKRNFTIVFSEFEHNTGSICKSCYHANAKQLKVV